MKQQHLLLCTLLISNAAAMEVSTAAIKEPVTVKNSIAIDRSTLISQALPVFLDELVPDWGAILLSVTLILLVGEVGS